MSALLLALVATASTSTASTSTASAWQQAAVGWEVAAEETRGELDEARADLAAERARSAAAVARADLATARGAEQIAELQLGLHAAKRIADERISRAALPFVAACAAGAVAAVAGLALCDSGECRQVLGIGGGAVGAAGCVALAVTW